MGCVWSTQPAWCLYPSQIYPSWPLWGLLTALPSTRVVTKCLLPSESLPCHWWPSPLPRHPRRHTQVSGQWKFREKKLVVSFFTVDFFILYFWGVDFRSVNPNLPLSSGLSVGPEVGQDAIIIWRIQCGQNKSPRREDSTQAGPSGGGACLARVQYQQSAEQVSNTPLYQAEIKKTIEMGLSHLQKNSWATANYYFLFNHLMLLYTISETC